MIKKPFIIALFLFLAVSVNAADLWYSENFDDQDIDSPPSGSLCTWASKCSTCNDPPGECAGGSNPWCGITEGGGYTLSRTGYGGTGYCYSNTGSPSLGCDTDAYFTIEGSSYSEDELFVTFRIRITGAVGEAYQNLKLVYPHWSGSSGYAMVNTANSQSGTNIRFYYTAHDKNGNVLKENPEDEVGINFYYSSSYPSDGSWHKVSYWVKLSTSEFKFWFDVETPTSANATLSKNYTDSAWAGSSFYYFGQTLADEGDNSTWDYKEVDDFEVWDGIPDGDPPDTTAPTLSNGSPSGSQTCTSNPRTITLECDSNEAATCRYGARSADWSAMAEMDTTGGTSHSHDVSLACDDTYSYDIICQDAAENESDPLELDFSIAAEVVSSNQKLIVGGQKLIVGGTELVIQ